jgi:hypothetical protein
VKKMRRGEIANGKEGKKRRIVFNSFSIEVTSISAGLGVMLHAETFQKILEEFQS